MLSSRRPPPCRAGEGRKITKREYETLAALRYALRRFERFSRDAARAAGITPHQHQALLAIKGFPGRDRVTIGELAERLQIRHHSAVGLADRLGARGLVARERATDDRRRVDLVLTRRGEALLAKLSSSHREEIRRVGPEIEDHLAGLHVGRRRAAHGGGRRH